MKSHSPRKQESHSTTARPFFSKTPGLDTATPTFFKPQTPLATPSLQAASAEGFMEEDEAGQSTLLQTQSAVGETEERQPEPGSGLQAKLTVGATDDPFEREADQVADQVVRRQAEEAGSKPMAWLNNPAAAHEIAKRGLDGPAQTLPHFDAIQRSFGRHEIGSVSAHIGGPAARAAQAMNARAYATGNAVAFRQTPDLHTAAHEAAHVVQQRGSVRLKSGLGETGDRHERHADAVADLVVQGLSSEALLDTYAWGGAPGRAVQRIDQPIVTPAPASAITIRSFIDLVKAEESRWPPAEQTQTALMITRLRKIFYGTRGWDRFLIPGGASISPGYTISEQETSRENLALPGPDAEIVRKRQVVTDAVTGLSPRIASEQEVRLEDGSLCDVGHVFTGLDAANRPHTVVGVADNKAAATWTGDIGSAVAEIEFKKLNSGSGSVSPADAQTIINEYASPQDMLGNIDAYVMADYYNISNTAGKKVSELLGAYYLSGVGTPDGRMREHRYSRFCSITGLTGWTGTAFGNEAAWINRWALEVGRATAFYFGTITEGKLSLNTRIGMIALIQINPYIRILLQAFLDALKKLVAAEGP